MQRQILLTFQRQLQKPRVRFAHKEATKEAKITTSDAKSEGNSESKKVENNFMKGIAIGTGGILTYLMMDMFANGRTPELERQLREADKYNIQLREQLREKTDDCYKLEREKSLLTQDLKSAREENSEIKSQVAEFSAQVSRGPKT